MSETIEPASPAVSPDADQDTSFKGFAAKRRGGTKRWSFFAKLAASGLLIAYVLSRANLSEVWAALTNVDPRWIALAFLCQLIGPAVIALRWRGLLDAQKVHATWLFLYRSTLISTFFRQFMPSTIGGDVIRGYDAWRSGASTGLAFMSLLIDRLMGLLALVILAMLALISFPDVADRLPGLRLWGAMFLAALLILVFLLVRPHKSASSGPSAGEGPAEQYVAPKGGKLKKIAGALALYRGQPFVLLRALGLSFVLQINVVTFYWALSMALGLPISYGDFYIIAPVAILVMMLPVSINGIGVREGIFVFLLEQWGVGASEAVALAWLEYSTFLAFGLLGGILFALRRR